MYIYICLWITAFGAFAMLYVMLWILLVLSARSEWMNEKLF